MTNLRLLRNGGFVTDGDGERLIGTGTRGYCGKEN